MLRDINKNELLELIIAYDEYIQDANDGDRYSDGFYPVCMEEFYMNEFQELKGSDKDS